MSEPTRSDGREPLIRQAERTDLVSIVQLLADDPVAAKRERFEDPLPAAYGAAFDAIDADANQELWVAVAPNEDSPALLAVWQLSWLPNLTYVGGWRAQIEGVRVAKSARGTGLGRRLIEHAIARADARGCTLIQLTTDNQRPDAIAFYEALGFTPSHVGMKRRL